MRGIFTPDEALDADEYERITFLIAEWQSLWVCERSCYSWMGEKASPCCHHRLGKNIFKGNDEARKAAVCHNLHGEVTVSANRGRERGTWSWFVVSLTHLECSPSMRCQIIFTLWDSRIIERKTSIYLQLDNPKGWNHLWHEWCTNGTAKREQCSFLWLWVELWIRVLLQNWATKTLQQECAPETVDFFGTEINLCRFSGIVSENFRFSSFSHLICGLSTGDHCKYKIWFSLDQSVF